MKTALLFVNVGSPGFPQRKSVGRYLVRFLTDPDVIQMPAIFRHILVRGIIVPFRAVRSAAKYRQVWTEGGSPLVVYSNQFVEQVQKLLPDVPVSMAYRYSSPYISESVEQLIADGAEKIILFPLYPQYAESTTGSAIKEFRRVMGTYPEVEPEIIGPFYAQPDYLKASAEKIKNYSPEHYDHVLFSYHGLPLSQVEATHPGRTCAELGCAEQIGEANAGCYQAQCAHNTRLLAGRLGLADGKYSMAYQSRLHGRWLRPFADEQIKNLPAKGAKRLLVVAPSFVTDCLETLHELDIEYRELFAEAGGENLDRVACLNADAAWAAVAKKIAGLSS